MRKIIPLILIICSCSAVQPTMISTEFDTQGHRGARGLVPENTWPSMKRALDLGVTTLEMDVAVTKDRKIVLSHEPWFSHEITTTPEGKHISKAEEMKYNLFRMDYEEIRKYDVGIKPHPRFARQEKIQAYKPLLSEIFDSTKQYLSVRKRKEPFFNIEIKSLPPGDGIFTPIPSEFVELVMGVIKEHKMENKVIIQSFDLRPLKYLHENYPGIRTALLIEDSEVKTFEEQLNALGFTPAIYSPNYNLVDKELVQKAHALGMKIIPWTVNDAATIGKLKKLGVDGIISDYPDLF